MGNNGSLPSEGTLESPSTSSPDAEELDSSQLHSNVSQGFSSNMSTPTSKHQSTIKPIPTPSPNNCYLDSDTEYLDHSATPFLSKVENSLLEESMLFDASETVSVLDSSFDSSSSSIINISEQSSESISEVDEQSNCYSESLLVDCVSKVKGLLKVIDFEHENPPAISAKTLNSLNELYQTIGEFVSNCKAFQCASANEGTSNINQIMSDCTISKSSTTVKEEKEYNSKTVKHTGKSCKKSKSVFCQTTADSSKSFCLNSIPQEESVELLNSTFYACSKCGTVVTDKSADVASPAAAISNTTSADNNSRTIKDCIQVARDDNAPHTSKDMERECMFVTENLTVEPLLLKSLVALQPKTGVDFVLTDAPTIATGTLLPLNTASQQLMPNLNRQSMYCSIKGKLHSTTLERIPESILKDTLSVVRHPIGLNEIINDDKSAATLGKAVIRNALVFEKYALLFRRALNDDIVTASIGKALCRNALLFENGSRSTVENINEESQNEDNKQDVNTTVDKQSSNIQDQVFISNQVLHGDKNKENENPTGEHLFKQTASKRKLGALEEETRRTKCFVLSQKSTAAVDKRTSNNAHNGDHLAKPVRKAKHTYAVNESTFNCGISTIEKAKKKKTLREIIMNGLSSEAKKQDCLLKTVKDKDDKEGIKKERWTVVKKNNEDMLELEDSDNESKLESSQSETEDITEYDQTDTLVGEKIDCRSKQLDSLTGIYYFASKYIFCAICNANIFNHLRILDHINGNVHKTNMMKHRNRVASFISTKAMLQSVWDQIDVSLGRKLFCKLVKFENDTLLCTLCNVQISGRLDVIAHVLAKQHKATSLDIIYSSISVSNIISKEGVPANDVHRKISWSDGSISSSDVSLAECEGSILEWLPASMPTPSTAVESDISGIYYFAKNYVFCSICNINMFNSSIVLGHAHAKAHQANTTLQKQIESKEREFSVFDNEKKIQKIWNQIERTLGGTLFRTVLCVDKNDNFFCDLCNMQIIIPGHLNILDHVCGKKHNKEFLKRVKLTSYK